MDEMGNGTEIQRQVSDRLSVPRFLSSVSTHAKRLDPKLLPIARAAMADIQAQLAPASKTEFAEVLVPRLTQCAPTGMNDDARTEWLNAAWIDLHELPLDLLKLGCNAARFADHPAKIVPAILREVEPIWRQRRGYRSDIETAMGKMKPDEPLDADRRCTPEEAAQIRKAEGIRYDDDGLEKGPDYIPVEKRMAPTREDYISWGVDPATLETMA